MLNIILFALAAGTCSLLKLFLDLIRQEPNDYFEIDERTLGKGE
jgi:hypothetical protein